MDKIFNLNKKNSNLNLIIKLKKKKLSSILKLIDYERNLCF